MIGPLNSCPVLSRTAVDPRTLIMPTTTLIQRAGSSSSAHWSRRPAAESVIVKKLLTARCLISNSHSKKKIKRLKIKSRSSRNLKKEREKRDERTPTPTTFLIFSSPILILSPSLAYFFLSIPKGRILLFFCCRAVFDCAIAAQEVALPFTFTLSLLVVVACLSKDYCQFVGVNPDH